VNEVDRAVAPLFADLADRFAALGGALVLASTQRHGELVPLVGSPLCFSELDLALEWCEDRLLAELGTEAPARIPLEQHELLRGLSDAGVAHVRQILDRRRFAPGELMIRKGDAADELFLILQGHLSVTLDLPGGERKRLATLSSGMVVGELALTSPGARRAADVWADSEVDCYTLAASELARLSETDPAIKITLLENLLHIVARAVRRLNEELTLLAPR
jgi:hypothetical protein